MWGTLGRGKLEPPPHDCPEDRKDSEYWLQQQDSCHAGGSTLARKINSVITSSPVTVIVGTRFPTERALRESLKAHAQRKMRNHKPLSLLLRWCSEEQAFQR